MVKSNHMVQAEQGASDPCLSIVVISYNTAELTIDCLRSIYREAIQNSFEVIVLDNASADEFDKTNIRVVSPGSAHCKQAKSWICQRQQSRSQRCTG